MQSKGFRYIMNMTSYFQPRTPFAALKAAEKGLLPAEAFVYKAVSIEPLKDNPENLGEIERILGQETRDFDTNNLLMDILNKLIRHPDKETALFAAESINAIENYYNRAVEQLPDDAWEQKAVLYSEMAMLNKTIPDLRNFYLREAFSNYRELEKEDLLGETGLLNMSRILIELGLFSQAGKILSDNGLESAEALFIMAEIAFREKDYGGLYTIMSRLKLIISSLDINQSELVNFWMDRNAG